MHQAYAGLWANPPMNVAAIWRIHWRLLDIHHAVYTAIEKDTAR
jgi:hypothetical protein